MELVPSKNADKGSSEAGAGRRGNGGSGGRSELKHLSKTSRLIFRPDTETKRHRTKICERASFLNKQNPPAFEGMDRKAA